MFIGSLADNLRLARVEATEADLERALRAVDAWDWVETLPQGFAPKDNVTVVVRPRSSVRCAGLRASSSVPGTRAAIDHACAVVVSSARIWSL